LTFWLDVANQAVNRGNFHIAVAVAYCLRKYKNDLDSDHQTKFENLSTLCSPAGGFKNIKTQITLRREQGLTSLPFLGIMGLNSVYFTEGNTEDGSLNSAQMKKLAQIYSTYINAPKDYPLPANPSTTYAFDEAHFGTTHLA